MNKIKSMFPNKALEKMKQALKTWELVSHLVNSVHNDINDDLLAHGVVSTGIVTGTIFLACDELLRVEKLAVGISVNFIHDCECLSPQIK